MPGSITPLPILAELDEQDRAAYKKLEAPKSIVVRYGGMRLVAELPYDGEAKPGCGSKLVIRTNRGIELGEMLTTTCGNGGCGKSVSRKQMLEYIENSGGRDYPFTTQGRVLRVASIEDLNQQSAHEARKPEMIKFTKALVAELKLAMKLVDVELLLGMDRIIFHYTSEEWVDFRDLVQKLAAEYRTRIEMHQVNARDEARLVADYEKCGQHCCCKQFLKVLKPVSMRSAKVQKATLDPTKISGRCGRLMCCLRYEDETYESLRKKLPKRNSRVTTPDGPGTVLDSQILTQLALVAVDNVNGTAAYPIENLTPLAREDDPMYKLPRPEGAAPGAAPGAGPGAGRPGGAPRGPGGPPRGQGRPERGGQGAQGGGPGHAGSAGGEAREGGRRDDRPRRDGEPRRPKPGQPLTEQEVESREGRRSDESRSGGRNDGREEARQDARPEGRTQSPADGRPAAPPRLPAPRGPESADEADDRDETGEDEGSETGEASGGEGGDGQQGGATAGDAGVGPDGEPRKRRRRRRRGRGRGRGGQGGPGGPGGPEGSGGGSGGPGPAGGAPPSGPA